MARAQHNPEMRTFLQEFCSLMGDHFTTLADKEDKAKGKYVSEISEAASSGTLCYRIAGKFRGRKFLRITGYLRKYYPRMSCFC